VNTRFEELRQWIGREESRSDQVTPAPAAALAAMLDRDDPYPKAGNQIPALWIWLYFLPLYRHSDIGIDGHVKCGGLLPPVPLPRRMFGGARMEFQQPLRIGDTIHRRSRIADVSHKQGRSGPLLFVKVLHEVSNSSGMALVEEDDIVYREQPRASDIPAVPQRAPDDCSWSREIRPNEVLLFRYSALTFNGHRIHYDRRYATKTEGYPGLVVHGPLIATFLADLLRRNMPGESIANFSFRAVRPAFDDATLFIGGKIETDGKTVKLWAADAEGWLVMDATARLR
jgi:3-methylfumaryl-CoA hydratase